MASGQLLALGGVAAKCEYRLCYGHGARNGMASFFIGLKAAFVAHVTARGQEAGGGAPCN